MSTKKKSITNNGKSRSTKVSTTQKYPVENENKSNGEYEEKQKPMQVSSSSVQKGKKGLKTTSSTRSNNPKEYFTPKSGSSANYRKANSQLLDTSKKKVTSTKYFPSKNMIKTALEEHTKSQKPNSPNKSNELIKNKTTLSSNNNERPKTATLTRSTIERSNLPVLEPEDANKSEEINTYEDDFDSYESDFEEYKNSSTSSSILEEIKLLRSSNDSLKSIDKTVENHIKSDEDKKLDSGNFDLFENKHINLLENIHETAVGEYTNTKQSENQISITSLSDEGYEEGKSITFTQCINFADAKKKIKQRNFAINERKRADELLNMLKLDYQNFSIFELPPLPYDCFIKVHGKSNTMQKATQMSETNMCEETQTDEILTANKHTQIPFDSSTDESKSELFTSTDNCLSDTYFEQKLSYFLSNATKLVTTILSEENRYSLGNIECNSDLPFSNGFVEFNSNIDLLKRTEIVHISFNLNGDLFLTVHIGKDMTSLLYMKTAICIWHINNPNMPEQIFTAYGKVNCSCFGTDSSIIYGGFIDGSVAVWSTFQKHSSDRSTLPTFITAITENHLAKVIKIVYFISNNDNFFNDSGNLFQQVCSLDENGTIKIWMVVKNKQGSYYENISLREAIAIDSKTLFPEILDFEVTDVTFDFLNHNRIYLSTNYGYILHCLKSGSKPDVTKFTPRKLSRANCLLMNHFSSEFILAGFSDGNVQLFSTQIPSSLKALSNNLNGLSNYSISAIEWSYNNPFILYTLDEQNLLHIWDLESSDIYPIYSVPFTDKLKFIKMQPTRTLPETQLKRSYMLFITGNGSIRLHLLNKQHGPQSFETYQANIEKYRRYIERL